MSHTTYKLMEIYQALLTRYGPQGWWPADSSTETIIGCILVQHAGWNNVELAIAQLKAHDLLDFQAIEHTDEDALAGIIRSAGTSKVKARRLKAFATWFKKRFQFDLGAMQATPTTALRKELLSIKGVGPETADCILLYAANQPSFVVDAYTHRILSRHLLAAEDWGYDELKDFFESSLALEAALYNEFHSLLVQLGKKHCRKKPLCQGCPLEHLEHRIED